MKVIGIRKSSFKGKDGTTVSGVNLYLTEPVKNGEGLSCDRVYVLDQRLNQCGYVPKLGDEVSHRVLMLILRSGSGLVISI